MDAVRTVVSAAHRAVRAVIERACEDAGVTVVERAGSAAETIVACRSMAPDLLILDLDLPDADGFEVLRELDEEAPSAVLVLADRA
ncbi:MAG TPA: response regulator, partial [Actinomycetota bacterium]|nr:response regulator [Actinomycetota bacterium]